MKYVWTVVARRTNHAGSALGRRLRPLVVIGLLGAVCLTGGLSAQENSILVDPNPIGEMISRNLTIHDGKLVLSLKDAIAIALERNLGLQVQRFNVAETGFRLTGTQGIFDVGLRTDLSAFDETTPAATALDGATVQKQDGQQWNFGADQLLTSGATVSLDWKNSRFKTNSVFFTLNPSFRSDLDLTVSQPLLRNWGSSTTKRNIIIARTNRSISRDLFEQRVVETAQAVEDAYWLLLEAQHQKLVADEALRLAQEFHDQNRVRVEVGTVAPLELIQSEAGVATRKEELIRARFLVEDRADNLRQLLNLETGELWDVAIVPSTPAEMDPVDVDLAEAIETAMENRPEIRSKRRSNENLEVDAAYFRNQTKPRLDLAVTYGFNGLGGDVLARDPDTGETVVVTPGGWGDSLSQLSNTEFPGWSTALNLLYPMGNRTAKANVAVAEVAVERGSTELRDLELTVRTEVRRAVRALETSLEAIESAKVSQRLALKNLEAEQKRYDNGMSTSYRVLDIQEDLTAARGRYIASVASYRRSLAALLRVSGTLMKYREIVIAEEGE